jgi:hypothetical protein
LFTDEVAEFLLGYLFVADVEADGLERPIADTITASTSRQTGTATTTPIPRQMASGTKYEG